jgi:hypothetical protein
MYGHWIINPEPSCSTYWGGFTDKVCKHASLAYRFHSRLSLRDVLHKDPVYAYVSENEILEAFLDPFCCSVSNPISRTSSQKMIGARCAPLRRPISATCISTAQNIVPIG